MPSTAYQLLRAEAAEDILDTASAASGLIFPSRAAAQGAAIPAPVARIAVRHEGLLLGYLRDPAGTALATAGGAAWSPEGRTRPEHWGAAAGSDSVAAIQAAVLWLEAQGGGTLWFAARRYPISATVRVRGNVWLRGEAPMFQSDYTDALELEGSWLELLPGSDCDLVLFRAEPDPAATTRRRVHAGLRDIGLWGRRSDSYAHAAKDLNATGSGVRISGVSYVTLDNVHVVRCADHGVVTESFDYGGAIGLLSPNNLRLVMVTSATNGGHGFSLFGGDAFVALCNAGNNGLTGINGGITNTTYLACSAWDNLQNGIAVSQRSVKIQGCQVYDNRWAGIVLAGADCRDAVVVGNAVFNNNVAATVDPLTAAGIAVQSNAQHVTIVGNHLYNRASGTPTQRRAIFVAAAPVHVNILANHSHDHTISEQSVLDRTNLNQSMFGGRFASAIDMAEQDVARIRQLSGATWTFVGAAPGGVINAGNHMLLNVSIAAPEPITDITANEADGRFPFVYIRNQGAATLVFANSTTMMVGGGSFRLRQHEGALFLRAPGSRWQLVSVPYHVAVHETRPYAGTVNLDMVAITGTVQTIALAGNLALTTGTRANGRHVTLRLVGDGTERSLTFPAGWAWVGGAAPATLAAGKTGLLRLRFFGGADTDAVAEWSVQP